METNLYKINSQISDLLNQVENNVNEETGEITENIPDSVFEQISALELSKQEIVKSCVLHYKDLLHEVERWKAEQKRIQAGVKSLEGLAGRIKTYISNNSTPGEKIKTPEYEISWCKSESVEIDPFANLAKEAEKTPELFRIKIEPDKTKIKQSKALPSWASINQKLNITIK